MTKLEMLFIRACKSENPKQRLESVYKRFYTRWNASIHPNLVLILSDICDEYFPFKTFELINDINTSYEVAYQDKVLSALVGKIRYTSVKELPEDFIKPLKHRNGNT